MAPRKIESESIEGNVPKKDSWKRKNTEKPNARGKVFASTKTSPGWSRSVKLYLAMTVVATCGAVFCLMWLLKERKTPIVSLIAIEYQAPWAPNGWAAEDIALLEDPSKLETFSAFKHERIKDGSSWESILKSQMDKMDPGGPGSGLILKRYGAAIIYLSAHGVVNGNDEPCLLFSDAKPLDDKTWVLLKDVLKRIEEEVASSTTRLLIVIDSGKQPPDARTGVLSNRFVERSIEVVHALPRENTAVLFSHSEGQEAWTAPELGNSFFGFLFYAGLAGLADDNDNGKLSVVELETFLAGDAKTPGCVDALVKKQRGQSQRPKLVWYGEHPQDFEIARANKARAVEWLKKLATKSFPKSQWDKSIKDLADVCEQFENLSSPNSLESMWDVDPIARAAALAGITRSGQLLMAGSAYEDDFQAELKKVKSALEMKRLGWNTNKSLPGESLAWIDRIGRRKNSGVQRIAATPKIPSTVATERVSSVSQSTRPASSPPIAGQPASTETPIPNSVSGASVIDIEEQARLWLESLTQPVVPAAPAVPQPMFTNREDAVKFCIRFGLDKDKVDNLKNLKQLQHALNLIGVPSTSAEISREEAFLSNMEFTSHGQANSDLQLQIMGEVLKQHQSLESVLATKDPRVARWLQSNSDKLNGRFRIVRDWAYVSESQDEANKYIFDRANVFEDDCKLLKEQRDLLENAWRLSDDLAFEIPLLADWSLQSTLANAVATKSLWTESIELHQELMKDDKDLKDVGRKWQILEKDLRASVGEYSGRLHELVTSSATDKAVDLGALVKLIRVRPPRWSRDYSQAFVKLSNAFDSKSISLKSNDYELIQSLSNVKKEQSDDSSVKQSGATESLLHSIISELDSESETTVSVKASPAFGQELRNRLAELPKALQKELEERWKVLEQLDPIQQNLAKAAIREISWKARCVANFLPGLSVDLDVKSVQRDLQIAKQEFALWQSQRWIDDFWRTPVLANDPTPFFEKAAKEWMNLEPEPKGPKTNQATEIQKIAKQSKSWLESQTLQSEMFVGNVREIHGTLPDTPVPSGTGWIGLKSYTEKHEQLFDSQKTARQRIAFKLGSESREKEYNLSTDLTTRADQYSLEMWFRGHNKAKRIDLKDRRIPFELKWASEQQKSATVEVHGDDKLLQILFVLDCSDSFKKPVGDPHRSARDQIEAAVKQLPDTTQLGLLAFGHSSDYLSETQYNVSPDFPSERQPWNDIQLIEDVQPLGKPGFRSNLINNLQKLRPHGRTPLYLSIIEARGILGRTRVPRGTEQRIVVLTDGQNDVHAKSGGTVLTRGFFKVPSEFDIGYPQVKDAVSKSGIRLDIIGYFYSGPRQDDLIQLARESGGDYYSSGDPRKLATQLEDSLISKFFEVRNANTRQADAPNKKRFDTKAIIDTSSLGKNLEVEVLGDGVGSPIKVVGGEALELAYSKNAQDRYSLKFMGIREDWKYFKNPNVVSIANQGYHVNILKKPNNDKGIRFGFENKEATKQSVRPDRIMVEIGQRVGGDETPRHRIGWSAGGTWETETRAPVLAIEYVSPPKDMRGMEVQIWIAKEPPSPNDTNKMSLNLIPEHLKIKYKMDVTFELNPEDRFAVKLKERVLSLDDAPMLHLYFVDDQRRSDVRVSHSFTEREIVHEYSFKGTPTDLGQIQVIPSVVLPGDQETSWTSSDWMRIP